MRKRAEAAAATEGESRENRFYICRELQVGAAVREGGTAMSMSCRRPVRGVLGALALNLRRCCGPTAIEPEVAIVMANLAKVGVVVSQVADVGGSLVGMVFTTLGQDFVSGHGTCCACIL